MPELTFFRPSNQLLSSGIYDPSMPNGLTPVNANLAGDQVGLAWNPAANVAYGTKFNYNAQMHKCTNAMQIIISSPKSNNSGPA